MRRLERALRFARWLFTPARPFGPVTETSFLLQMRILSAVKTLFLLVVYLGTWVKLALAWDAEKMVRAKQDCDTIAQAIQKFNSLEGTELKDLAELRGKYLCCFENRDPWGRRFLLDLKGGEVLSRGPDGETNLTHLDDPVCSDDIRVRYIGAIVIVKVGLEINPTGSKDSDLAFDALHLTFNRRVAVPDGVSIDLTASCASTAPPVSALQGKIPDPACALGLIFRWYEMKPRRVVAFAELMKLAGRHDPAAGASVAYTRADDPSAIYRSGEAEPGRIYHTGGSREIVLTFPAGSSGAIVAGCDGINLTGNRMNVGPDAPPRPLVRDPYGRVTVEMSGCETWIEVYEDPGTKPGWPDRR